MAKNTEQWLVICLCCHPEFLKGVRDLGIDLESIQIPRPFAPPEAAGTCPRNDKQCIAFTAHWLSPCPERKRLGAVHAHDPALPSLPPDIRFSLRPLRPLWCKHLALPLIWFLRVTSYQSRVTFFLITSHKVPQAQRQGAPLVNTPPSLTHLGTMSGPGPSACLEGWLRTAPTKGMG